MRPSCLHESALIFSIIFRIGRNINLLNSEEELFQNGHSYNFVRRATLPAVEQIGTSRHYSSLIYLYQ